MCVCVCACVCVCVCVHVCEYVRGGRGGACMRMCKEKIFGSVVLFSLWHVSLIFLTIHPYFCQIFPSEASDMAGRGGGGG